MRLISRDRLKAEKGIDYSYDWLCALERKGLFPKSIPVGANRRAYIEEEIDAWIKAKADSRDEPPRPGRKQKAAESGQGAA